MSRHVRFHKPLPIPEKDKAEGELVEVVEPVEKKDKPKTVKRPTKKKK